MSGKEDVQTIIADHLGVVEAYNRRFTGIDRARNSERYTRAIGCLKVLREEAVLRQNDRGQLTDQQMQMLRNTIAEDVREWIAGTSCPNCGTHVG